MRIVRHDTKAVAYVANLYAQEDTLLHEIRDACAARNMSIHVGADEGKLLQMLIRLHGAHTIVEIGTLGGYSALWMARALPPEGHVWTLEKDAEHAAMARGFIARSDVADRVTVIEGDAHATLATLSAQAPFDMVFIDADKQGYPRYLDWADQYVRARGLIVADNTFLFGSVWEDSPQEEAPATWKAMREFNMRLADTSRYHATILPTHEGLSVAIKL